MTATLVLQENLKSELLVAALRHVETAGVLICSVVKTPGGDLRLLARELCWVPEEAYEERECDSMLIKSEGYVPALGHAEELGSAAIWLHTHPGAGSSPRPSRHDQKVDRAISDLFCLRTGQDYFGSVIIATADGELTFAGHVSEGKTKTPITRLLSVGRRFSLVTSIDSKRDPIGLEFDRNIRAFGGDVQAILADLNIGIIGCGGTGSAIAEQLVRLGVRHFHLADPDHLTASNVTRVYGSSPTDVGDLKVEVLARHLRRIAPDADVTVDAAMITLESSARQLVGCDCIFGCSDDNAGRLVLSRIASFLLLPVIDCGVLLSSDASANGMLTGINGRITTLVPGSACLVCRDRVDLQRAGSELLTPEERVRLVNEGYAPALGDVEPAVVAFTTMVAAVAVSELLERLIRYGPDPSPTEVLLRMHDRELSTNVAAPRPGHYCDPQSQKIGKGMTEPFLEQTWP
jgi:ThiF family